MPWQDDLATLHQALRDLLEDAGVPLNVASEALGHHGNYLTRVLRGEIALRLDEMLTLLEMYRVDTQLFLRAIFPFGGAAMAEIQRQIPPDFWRDPDLERVTRAAIGEGPLSPQARCAKACRVLKRLLKRRRISQKRASLALGLGPHAFEQVLCGRSNLHCGHLFAVLEICRTPPGRFFLDLFGLPEHDLLGGLAWTRHLDRIEAGLAEVATQAARRLRTERRPQGSGRPRGSRGR